MEKETLRSEFVLAIDGEEQCPECGHLWTDDGSAHYHDCRYFFVDGENDDDGFFFEKSEEAAHFPTLKTAA